MPSNDDQLERYPAEVQQRFWAKVLKTAGCWWWQAAKDRAGYGQFGRGGQRERMAHRVSYELANGLIPVGMIVCHTCDYPSCINPAHLFLGTHEDNAQDKLRKGRHRLKPPPEYVPKTHCPQGHELSGENLMMLPTKHHAPLRVCRTCANEKSRQRKAFVRAQKAASGRTPRTHCKNGHELTEENLVKGATARKCRICKNERVRRHWAKTYVPAERILKTHCKHGHELSGDNVIQRKDTTGQRCRTCKNGHTRRLYQLKK